MEDNTLVQSSFSATINAPIEKVDIPSWCFTLPESEYQSCSPARCSAGTTTSPDGPRMSISVEVLGGSRIVQHYVEEIGQPDHLIWDTVQTCATPELLDFHGKHNQQETPMFAKSIERHALRQRRD
jgi:hypothetical protein